MEGGSCNDYDYVCGDPVNGLDLSGLRGTKPLPDHLERRCLGGSETDLNDPECRRYQQAKVTGDSDFYYEGKTLTEPGKPNAFLAAVGNGTRASASFVADNAASAGEYGMACIDVADAQIQKNKSNSRAAVVAGAVGCATGLGLQYMNNRYGTR